MKIFLQNLKEKIYKNRKIVGIILILFIIFIVLIIIKNIKFKKRLEMEKNTDTTNSIHAIVIKDDIIFSEKPKHSRFSKISNLKKGTNAYILEEYIDEKENKWYKVKSQDRLGYVLQDELAYFKKSNDEVVLMSDVSKFDIQYEHFKTTEDYEIFLIEKNINYVYVRLGGRGYGDEGNFYTDKYFKIFRDACEYLKIPYGYYYIDEAINSEEVDEEIEFVCKFLQENKTSMCKLPLVIDIENHDGKGRAEKMWENRVFLAEELVQKFNLQGIPSIIYSNAKTANQYLSNANAKFWIAYYPQEEKIPNYWYSDTDQEPAQNEEFMQKVIGWQFTENGVGKIINEKVDVSLVKNNFFGEFVKEGN